MHGPNGTNYPNESVFREIQPDTRVVIEHVLRPWYRLTVTPTARGDQTHLAWDQEFESPHGRREVPPPWCNRQRAKPRPPPVAACERKLLKPPIANQCSKSETVNFCTGAQKKFNSRLVAPSLEYLLGSRTVNYK